MEYMKSSLSSDRASQMFFDSLEDRWGSPYSECDCGIEHYALMFDHEDFHGDRPEKESETVKFYDNATCLMTAIVDGKRFVEECDNCMKKLARYEQWIFNNRDTIRTYLKTRIDHEKIWADQENVANILAGF